jgi:hypothetical protein
MIISKSKSKKTCFSAEIVFILASLVLISVGVLKHVGNTASLFFLYE